MSSPIGLLIMHYGTPASLEDVEAYYTHIRHGRPPAPEDLEDLVSRYRAIGGPSPLTAVSEKQAALILEGVRKRGIDAKLYIGAKHTTPFIGDYIDIGFSQSFIPLGDGTWRFNTQPADPSVYFATAADNRDVRAPADGNWKHYTPPTFARSTGMSLFDPTKPLEVCLPGQAGMRNQNIYTARLFDGIDAYAVSNSKYLRNR